MEYKQEQKINNIRRSTVLSQNIRAGALNGLLPCAFNDVFLGDYLCTNSVRSQEGTGQPSLPGVSLATGLKVEQEVMINNNFVPGLFSYLLDRCFLWARCHSLQRGFSTALRWSLVGKGASSLVMSLRCCVQISQDWFLCQTSEEKASKKYHQKLMHRNSILAFYSQSEHTYAPMHTDRQTDTHPEGFCLRSDRFHNFKILRNLGKLVQIMEAMSSFILSIEETFASGHFFQSLNLLLFPQRIRSMWTSRASTVSSRIL